MFLIAPTPDTQCFLSPSQHEFVSTLEAKIPRNFRYFLTTKAKIHLRNKPKLYSRAPNTMQIFSVKN